MVGSSGVGAMMGSSDGETILVNEEQRQGSNVWQHVCRSIKEQWYQSVRGGAVISSDGGANFGKAAITRNQCLAAVLLEQS